MYTSKLKIKTSSKGVSADGRISQTVW